MLENAEERVRLLKLGIHGDQVEQLYIRKNRLRVVNDGALRDSFQRLPDSHTCAHCQSFQGCARLISRHGDEDICDYMPSRFKAKVMEVIEC